MSDSNSFTSLLDLVNSHLSKTSIQDNNSEDRGNIHQIIPIASTSHAHNNLTQSDTMLGFSPGQRLPIPTFKLGSSPIDNVLAEQVSNMLKAKALKKQQEEEKQRVEEENMRIEEEMQRLKLQEEDDVLDLTQALQIPGIPRPSQPQNEELSSSSSFESLFEPKFIDCDFVPERPKTPEPVLPCTTDMSYILKTKIRSGKSSSFGKVLTSRLRPVAAPYIMMKVDSNVKRFDFSTPSPCDVIKEKLRKPSCYNAYSVDIFGLSSMTPA